MRLSNKNPDASERTPMPETSLDRNLFLANYFAQRTPTPETSLDRNLFLAFFFLLSKPLRQRLFFFWTVAKSQDNGADKLCLCFVVFFFVCGQSQQLKTAGLTCYNHNLDTSPEFYPKITSSRTYDDRLDTLGALFFPFFFLCVWICICV